MIANEVIQFSERLQQETESIINKINGSEKEKTWRIAIASCNSFDK